MSDTDPTAGQPVPEPPPLPLPGNQPVAPSQKVLLSIIHEQDGSLSMQLAPGVKPSDAVTMMFQLIMFFCGPKQPAQRHVIIPGGGFLNGVRGMMIKKNGHR